MGDPASIEKDIFGKNLLSASERILPGSTFQGPGGGADLPAPAKKGPTRVNQADIETSRSKAAELLKRRRTSSLATRRPLGQLTTKTVTLGGA